MVIIVIWFRAVNKSGTSSLISGWTLILWQLTFVEFLRKFNKQNQLEVSNCFIDYPRRLLPYKMLLQIHSVKMAHKILLL
jgi:hypothetical protein